MSKALRERALNYLNQMEVIESQGGEEAYALVENNEENRYLLTEAGIPLETALKYGGGDTFCILSLACSEGYATWYTGAKLIFNEVSVSEIESKILERISLLDQNGEKERQAELHSLMNWILSGGDY